MILWSKLSKTHLQCWPVKAWIVWSIEKRKGWKALLQSIASDHGYHTHLHINERNRSKLSSVSSHNSILLNPKQQYSHFQNHFPHFPPNQTYHSLPSPKIKMEPSPDFKTENPNKKFLIHTKIQPNSSSTNSHLHHQCIEHQIHHKL